MPGEMHIGWFDIGTYVYMLYGMISRDRCERDMKGEHNSCTKMKIFMISKWVEIKLKNAASYLIFGEYLGRLRGEALVARASA